MSYNNNHLSTGIAGLDNIIKGVMPGDNIVWQVNDIEDYRFFVKAYADFAVLKDQRLIYFRFSKHKPLIDENYNSAEIYLPNPALGFEPFISFIHSVIKKNGRGGYYIFDSLTELSDIWNSDRMLGNFFMLTCPYLLDVEALAYFALLRNTHSYNALTPVHDTAQVVIDVYKKDDIVYVHPLKVQQRYSSTMHMLHCLDNGKFLPVTNSALNSEILSFSPFKSSAHAFEEKDRWNRYFFEASQLAVQNNRDNEKEKFYITKLLTMVFTKEEKILELAEKYLTIEDILDIGRRMIGTGLIGGKSAGMLLARAILKKNSPSLKDIIEIHDSFFVGSDVFYTYMVINGCWWIRHQQKDIESFLTVAEYARRVILTGKFTDSTVKKFSDMLDYYGQSPIIVRSSSLLEDNFGNAFSGKYESIFCPNQGSRETRLENLLTAIKTIYASTLSEKALRYRSQLGILDRDEQMPLLIQRVSGDLRANYFFPTVGGVGYSYNPFVWNDAIKPDSGLIRIVFGMGTRAVDRSDDDYTRIASLSAPDKRPETDVNQVRKYSQKKIDAIDLEANQLVIANFSEIAEICPVKELEMVASTESSNNSWYITFDGLFNNTDFVSNMSEILSTLEKAYSYPVDIEFTLNFTENKNYRINIVQCRPFEARKSKDVQVAFTEENIGGAIIGSQNGIVIGRSRTIHPTRIIFVHTAEYDELTVSQKHLTARAIGKIMKLTANDEQVVLVGPGRWGTTTVSLGIPVSFAEISRAVCICEVVAMREDLVPDVSLGTHFFNDLVEFDILYLALYPQNEGSIFNPANINKRENKFTKILTGNDFALLEKTISVVDFAPEELTLTADIFSQKYILFE